MFENIAAAHRWAIDEGAARTKLTPAKSRSQVYYDLVRNALNHKGMLHFLLPRTTENTKPRIVWQPGANLAAAPPLNMIRRMEPRAILSHLRLFQIQGGTQPISSAIVH